MATVQVVRDGTVVIFGVAGKDGGSKRLVASLMHGKVAGLALMALRSLEVPSLRSQLSQPVSFDVPLNYRVGGVSIPNTKENRRYLRMRIPGREALWFRFARKVEPELIRLLEGISARPVTMRNNPAGPARRFKFGQGSPLATTREKRRLAMQKARMARKEKS